VTLWRLEWLRLWRTRRWIALAAAYLIFGLLGPPLARYADVILKHFGGGQLRITVPKPVPADGIANFVKNSSQIGLVVVVVVSAAALAFDANPEMGAFLRTRAPNVGAIIVPRYATNAVAAAVAFVLGTLAAWYETAVLLGSLPAGRMVVGMLLGVLYLAFAVAVVALCAAIARSVLAAVMLGLAVLIALPIAGLVRGVGRWLPSDLVGALSDLASGAAASAYVRAAAVTIVVTPALLWLAVRRAAAREL